VTFATKICDRTRALKAQWTSQPPLEQGCQIFHGTTYQNGKKYTKMAKKCTKWQQNRPNSRKIYQHLSLQDTSKFTETGILV
jgi:hypothetical protein